MAWASKHPFNTPIGSSGKRDSRNDLFSFNWKPPARKRKRQNSNDRGRSTCTSEDARRTIRTRQMTSAASSSRSRHKDETPTRSRIKKKIIRKRKIRSEESAGDNDNSSSRTEAGSTPSQGIINKKDAKLSKFEPIVPITGSERAEANYIATNDSRPETPPLVPECSTSVAEPEEQMTSVVNAEMDFNQNRDDAINESTNAEERRNYYIDLTGIIAKSPMSESESAEGKGEVVTEGSSLNVATFTDTSTEIALDRVGVQVESILSTLSQTDDNEADDPLTTDSNTSRQEVSEEPHVRLTIEEDNENYMKLQNAKFTRNEVTVPENITRNGVCFISPEKVDQAIIVEECPGISLSININESGTARIGYLTIAPKTVRPTEIVEDVKLIFWIVSGKVTVRSAGYVYSNSAADSKYMYGLRLTEGSCFIINPNTCYTIENWEGEEALLGYTLLHLK